MNAVPIPRAIHHVWLGSPLPDHLASLIDTWRDHHPDWLHRVWTDADIAALGLINGRIYDRAADYLDTDADEHAVWQLRSDIARYEILYWHGGIYADTDTTCQRPLADLVDARPGRLVAAWEVPGEFIGNTVLAAPPGHDALADLIEALPAHVERIGPARPNRLTGPKFITPRLRGRADVDVLDSGVFYPVPWNAPHRSDTEDHPGAYVVHHWGHQRAVRGLPAPTLGRAKAPAPADVSRPVPGVDELDALEGLITPDIGRTLHEHAARVAPGHAIVEIGSYHGKSTAYLAHGAPEGAPVVAVDPWSEDVSHWRRHVTARIPAPSFATWEAQLRRVGLRERVTAMRALSVDAAAAYTGPPVGLIYIDGDHDEAAARDDLDAWGPHLAPDAAVIFDDYDTPGNPGVTRAVHAASAAGTIRGLHVIGRLAVGTWAHPSRKPMRVSAAIMAHPTRAGHVAELQAALDREVPVSWDVHERPSAAPARRWATGRGAWELYDPGADWHLVIQDDALVCADLIAGLEAALDHVGPSGLVSAYTGTGRPDQQNVRLALYDAARRGRSWLSTWSLNWGVAIAAPTATIPAMLEWCDDPKRSHLNYDMRIGQYYRDVLGWRTWYTHPSLVDHRDTASLIGHGAGGDRVAHHHHSGSALDIDWGAHSGLPIGVPPNARRPVK